MKKLCSTTADCLLIFLVCSLAVINVNAQDPAPLFSPPLALNQSAVCLDGSPAGYYFSKGYGSAANNWLIYLEGGGWCHGSYCTTWITHDKPGTYSHEKLANLTGILSPEQSQNPDFYNWNRVRVIYCDGSCFMGNVRDPNQPLIRAGMRVYNSIMGDLMAKGLGSADNAILAGGSAGGLATMLHCDTFREMIPDVKRVKCISDSGFFIAGTDHSLVGFDSRENRFGPVIEYHNASQYLPAACKSRMNLSMCMNPPNFVEDIKTPLLVIESGFDNFQIKSGLGIVSNCSYFSQNCTAEDIQNIKAFRELYLKSLMQHIPKNSPWERGLFVDSCAAHGHLELNRWRSPLITVGGKTIQQAIGDWYFERAPVYEVDTRDAEFAACACPPEMTYNGYCI